MFIIIIISIDDMRPPRAFQVDQARSRRDRLPRATPMARLARLAKAVEVRGVDELHLTLSYIYCI